MFKKYGIAGIILIVLLQVNFFLKIQPFANWYFPLIWVAYILVIDAAVYNLRGRSWINNHFLSFVGVFILSAFFWYIFEALNIFVQNWSYAGTAALGAGKGAFKFLSFAKTLSQINTYFRHPQHDCSP